MSSGDGHIAPAAAPALPGLPETEGRGEDVQQLMLAEMRKQTAVLEETRDLQKQSRDLLWRVVLGDVDELDREDVKLAINCGDRTLDELVRTKQIPMYQRVKGGKWRIGRDTLRAVLRGWAAGKK